MYKNKKAALARLWFLASGCLFLFSSATVYAQADYNTLSTPFYDPTSQDCRVSGVGDTAPGTGSPQGLSFPNLDPQNMANAIDAYIAKEKPESPFNGLGATMVATAKHSNINPFIFVAIAQKESGLGTTGVNIQPGRYNAFGRTASSRQPHFIGEKRWYKWESFKASVDYSDPSHAADPSKSGDMGSYIRAVYGKYVQANSFQQFFMTYAPPSENDTNTYIQQVKDWFAEMAALASGDTPPPASAPTVTDSCGTVCSVVGGNSNTVVLDPGHAGAATTETDPATGLKAQESPNDTERQEMWDTAQAIKAKLEKAGYRVVLTKNSKDDEAGLLEKARRVNESSAAIAVSLHYTPGTFGEVPADSEHWGVTPQEVGRFRENQGDGKRVTFTDADIATRSQQYAKVIAEERNKVGDKTKISPLDKSFPKSRGLLAWGDISIVQLFAKIPWVYNEVGKTGFNGDKYAEGIANGIMKAVPIAGSVEGGATSGCSGPVTGDAVATAIHYAWPEYHPPNYLKLKPSYKSSVDKAKKASKYVGGGIYPGVDCGGFVTRVMQDSGADPEYGGGGNTISQQSHMEGNPDKYIKLGQVRSTIDLQPGDIAINSRHTFMYVGEHPGFETKVASASYSETNTSWRSPMAGREDVIDSSYTWYRLKK